MKFVNAFIPAEFVLDGVSQISIDPATQAPGRALHGNPMYGVPGIGFFSLELNSLALGAALALFDEYDAQMTARKTVNPPFTLRSEDTFPVAVRNREGEARRRRGHNGLCGSDVRQVGRGLAFQPVVAG